VDRPGEPVPPHVHLCDTTHALVTRVAGNRRARTRLSWQGSRRVAPHSALSEFVVSPSGTCGVRSGCRYYFVFSQRFSRTAAWCRRSSPG
jgi:hypothetical protein